jgi:hypothetical protein
MLLTHASLHIPKSGTSQWWGRDNQETYEENLWITPEHWRYRTENIQYQVNSQGYRCPEFDKIDWDHCYAILGCSVVFGLGVSESETISHLLGKKLDYPVINLGVSGSGCDWQYWNAIALYNQGIRPRKIIMHWPNPCRGMFFNQERQADTYINSNLELPDRPIHISNRCDLNSVYAEEHHWYMMLEMYAKHLTVLFGDKIQHVWYQANLDTLKKYQVPDFDFDNELTAKTQILSAKKSVNNLARDLEHPGGSINENIVVPYLLDK